MATQRPLEMMGRVLWYVGVVCDKGRDTARLQDDWQYAVLCDISKPRFVFKSRRRHGVSPLALTSALFLDIAWHPSPARQARLIPPRTAFHMAASIRPA